MSEDLNWDAEEAYQYYLRTGEPDPEVVRKRDELVRQGRNVAMVPGEPVDIETMSLIRSVCPNVDGLAASIHALMDEDRKRMGWK